MPELPEVETVVRQLNKKVLEKKIDKVLSDHKKMVKSHNFSEFKKKIIGEKIKLAKRRGKNIFISLSGKKTLWMHLKMTGHLLYKPKVLSRRENIAMNYDSYNKYIHFKIIFNDKTSLEFSDLRKFGRIKLIEEDMEKVILDMPKYGLDKIGIEPLDENLGLDIFKEAIKYRLLQGKKVFRNKNVKEVLLDQEAIAGIGNIYASEILFLAGIKPQRKVAGLSNIEVEKIFKAMRKILKKSIKNRGTSVSDFRDLSGEKGENEKDLWVYQKEKKECQKCGHLIKRIKQGQRSTFYCDICQR